MGGKSSSKSSSSTKNWLYDYDVSGADYREVGDDSTLEGNLNIVGSSGVSVYKTDYGAIKSAGDAFESVAELGVSSLNVQKDITKMVIDQGGENLKESLDFATDQLTKNIDAIGDSQRRSDQLVTDALNYTSGVIKVGNQSEGLNMLESLMSVAPKLFLIGGVVYAVVKVKGKK
tara:strand:+ start:6812 stop:7333 length:522 start_codon:yes stop_codon:yes gene_type:complete